MFKGYLTADAATRDAIGLWQFLKGLTDQSKPLMLGMKEMSSLDEAKLALDKYFDLKGDSTMIKAVNAAP